MRPSLLPDRVYAEVRGFQWHRDSKYGGDASLQIVRDVGTRQSVDGHRSATEPGRATRQAAPASAAARCAATCVSAPPGVRRQCGALDRREHLARRQDVVVMKRKKLE
jgi:hypothetical protein